MPLYEYKAYDAAGKTAIGLIDAPSQATAHSKLKSSGLFPIEIFEDTGKDYRASVPIMEMVFALQQLCTLLKANVPLPEALDSLVGQLDNEQLKRGFARVKVHLEEGHSFAASLAAEQIFPPVLVRMTEAGESVGAVDRILERFTTFLEKETDFKEKVLSSMLYPAIILVASSALIFFVLSYIAPTLVSVFASFHQEMPLPTKILLFAGSFLKNNMWLLVGIIVAFIFIYTKILTETYRDAIVMKIPFYGTVHMYIQMSRWARTLSMLHGGGVNLLKALASAREVVDNRVIREELKMIEDYVQKGMELGSAMSKVPMVPTLIVQMTRTGEKSGELENLLETAAIYYEKEVDKRLSRFFRFLEPAVIIFLGFVVGFVAVSALLPIFEINRLIK